MSIKALERHLIPFTPFLQMDGVTEICIHKPQELFVEKAGRFICYLILELEYDFLETLAGLIAENNHKDFPVPLLSGSLPDGERIQFAMNPSCESQKIICSIRRRQMKDMALDDYAELGAFAELTVGEQQPDKTLNELYHKKDILGFIKQAILARKNILISGGTGTGKMTFLNAFLKYIPEHERIITVEDTREVRVAQSN